MSDVETRTATAVGDEPVAEERTAATVESNAAVGGVYLSAGARIDRYVILDVLGEGGMGVVYKAYDPELDRRIALKLHHLRAGDPDRAARARARLLREAQALAQLTHPHVVAAYDAGEADGGVFVAMEYVEGDTLKTWLAAAPRSRREILEVMIAAGRGLAAAHAAGLVHRDFKPDNVLIGRDGRVRVADFGLARATGELTASDDDIDVVSGTAGATGERLLASQVTQLGSVVGTPAYMAPEQFACEPLDTHTDQYAFCVTLYEALVGVKPFSAKTPDALRAKVVAGELDPRPAGVRLPRRLWKLMTRGLSAARARRHASMAALLGELERDVRRTRRRVVEVAAMVGLAAVAVVALARGGGDPRSPCSGVDDGLAGAWDGPARAAVEASFDATGLSYAGATFSRVAALLDRRAEDWRRARREVCAATRERGEQSSALMDLRMRCLDERLAEMRALTVVFATGADAATVDRAVTAVARLAPLAYCDDAAALTAAVPPPADPATRERVEALEGRLRTASALRSAGRYVDALAHAQTVVGDADGVGYAPLLAAALFEHGRTLSATGDYEGAEATLLRSARVAAGAKDDRLVAQALVELVALFPRFAGREADARAVGRMARIAVERLGDELERAALMHLEGVAASQDGHLDEARELLEGAHAIRSALLGDDSVLVAATSNALGSLAARRGDFAAAVDAYTRALAVAEQAFGADHPNVAITRGNLCYALSQQQRFADARACHERVLATLQRVHGPEHADVAWALNDYGLALQDEGDLEGARREFERAAAIWERTVGADHPDLALTLVNVGAVAIAERRWADAIAACARARDIRARSAAADDRNDVYHLGCLGRAQLGAGDVAAARRELEAALAVRDGGLLLPTETAALEFALARALWPRRVDRARARQLAERARAAFAAAGDAAAAELAEVNGWLAGR